MKKKFWINVLYAVTLVAPISIYILLMATVFRIEANSFVYGTTSQVEVVEQDEQNYIVALVDEVSFSGKVEKVGETYGLFLADDDTVKFDNGYFKWTANESGVFHWKDIKLLSFEKELSYKVPLSLMVIILGVLIVTLVISKKMNWQKDKPRLAVFVSLLAGTAVLAILNFVIGDLLGVFIIATLSWGAFTIEYEIAAGNVDNKKGEKAGQALTDLIDALNTLK